MMRKTGPLAEPEITAPRTALILSRRAFVAGSAALLGAGPALAQKQEVVVATTGGAFNQGLKQIWFDPFTKASGIEVTTVSATDSDMRTRAQAMFQAKNVSWDIIINVDIMAASPQNRAFSEDLSDFCRQFADRKDLTAQACDAAGMEVSLNSTLLAYNTSVFKDRPPQNWADFWNLSAFPGPRALPNFGDPWRVFAAALLADGVAPDALFPLDIPRALAKLDAIRPHIQLWWKTGDQSQQGFRNGDYVAGMIWGTRANALKAEGRPVQVSYNQAFMLADKMQVIRNSPNKPAALALLKFYLDSPAVQAGIAERFGVSPPSIEAVALMPEAARDKIPTSPQVLATTIKHDAAWISANQGAMLEAWNGWMQK